MVLALGLYVFWRVLKVLHFYFREYYVLWHVAMGASSARRAMSTKIRLHLYVCKTVLLDEVAVNEIYGFLLKMLDSDVTIKEFHSVLLSYKFAIMCRERKDGSLRGVMLMGVDHRETEGGVKYTLVRLGLSFFQNYYRGGPLLYYATVYHVLKELILHPFTPLYVIGKVFSYKSYVALCHSLPRLYPRHDLEVTDFTRGIINDYGMECKTPGEEYDPETFVLKRERTAVKDRVAYISDIDLRDPHIKFFVEQNPDWARGHQMIVAGEVGWLDVLKVSWKMLWKARHARKEDGCGRPRRRRTYDRHYSFQNETAERYNTVFSEVDVGGGRSDHTTQEEEEEEEGGEGEGGKERPTKRKIKRLISYDFLQDL